MNASGCCHQDVPDPSPQGSRWRRVGRIASWIVPSVILAAMPKCPICVAAYVTLFTGCGVSLAAAGTARWLVMAGSLAVLAYLAVKGFGSALNRLPSRASNR
jgi:hypothetical protein